MKSLFKLQTSIFLGLSFYAASTLNAAVPFQLINTITHPFPSEDAGFGTSMATFNSNLLVGGRGQPQTAYLINPTDGSPLLTLTSPDLNNGAITFGDNVLQVGQNIVVTDRQVDYGGNVRVGSVYIYDGTTGQNLFTIRDPNPQTFDWFGQRVETVDGKLLISSRASDSGNVHIYNPNTATLLNTISNPEPGPNSRGFGEAMLTHNGNVFISSTYAPVAGANPGAVYLYNGTTMSQMMKFSSPNPLTDDRFGESIAASGSKLLVGANADLLSGGTAYLFDANNGTLLHTFNNPEPGQFGGTDFGHNVELVGNYAVVGASFAQGFQTGAMYVFDTISGDYVGKIPTPSGAFRFPTDLLVVGNTLYASNEYLPVNNLDDAGGIFVYTVIPEPSQSLVMIIGAAVCVGALSRKKRMIQ